MVTEERQPLKPPPLSLPGRPPSHLSFPSLSLTLFLLSSSSLSLSSRLSRLTRLHLSPLRSVGGASRSNVRPSAPPSPKASPLVLAEGTGQVAALSSLIPPLPSLPPSTPLHSSRPPSSTSSLSSPLSPALSQASPIPLTLFSWTLSPDSCLQSRSLSFPSPSLPLSPSHSLILSAFHSPVHLPSLFHSPLSCLSLSRPLSPLLSLISTHYPVKSRECKSRLQNTERLKNTGITSEHRQNTD